MIVTITAEAEADLEQIATYVAEQSARSALELVRELRRFALVLPPCAHAPVARRE